MGKRKIDPTGIGAMTDVATLAVMVAERLGTPDVVYCHAFISDMLKDISKDLMNGIPRNIQGFCTIIAEDNSQFSVAGMKLKREYRFKALAHREIAMILKNIEVAHDRDTERGYGKKPSKKVQANPLAK